ncbi:MAG: membrane protein insertase YidC [Spirochaetaceae bacterium]|nr:membrane protein insertase YidC [Spirochaetaceae bacterium]
MIFNILIKPLELFLGVIFQFLVNFSGNYGISLILLSIVVNIILIPVYYPIEKIKSRNKLKQKKMDLEIAEIKECYKGQERFYYIRAIHRQYRYKPLHSIIPSLGLLIQIPFFLAAYQLLSHYTGYAGESFLFIEDLSKADGAWDLGVISLNLLPIVMTALNGVSSLLYTKGNNPSERYQLWGLAALFFFLLYKSPAALVLYWTMNNLFALVKQIIGHKGESLIQIRKRPSRENVLKILYYGLFSGAFFLSLSLIGYFDRESTLTVLYLAAAIAVLLYITEFIGIFSFVKIFQKKVYQWIIVAFMAVVLVFQVKYSLDLIRVISALICDRALLIPLIKLSFLQGLLIIVTYPSFRKIHNHEGLIDFSIKPSGGRFVLSLSFILFLIFFNLPIQIFSSLPSAFSFSISGVFQNNVIPFVIIFFLLSFLYFLTPRKGKILVEFLFTYMALSSFVYAFFIQLDFGSLDGFILTREKSFLASFSWYLLEFSLLICLFLIVQKLYKSKKHNLIILFSLLNILIMGQSLYQTIAVISADEKTEISYNKGLPSDTDHLLGFSRDKENVIVFMLDMFQGSYISHILHDDPALKNIYSGFTWYPNTLSASYYTNASLPVLLAGWDFEPRKMDQKPGKNLMEKIAVSYESLIDQAHEEDLEISFIDPSFYRAYTGDITSLQELGAYAASSSQFRNYWDDNHGENRQTVNEALSKSRLLYMIGLFRVVPFALKSPIYSEGGWLSLKNSIFSIQKSNYSHVISKVAFLKSLPYLANRERKKGTFKFFLSELTHSPFAIAEDGTILDDEVSDSPTPEVTKGEMSYYSAHWAMVYIGDFLTWLKENEIYDNTKIILVSDHGIHEDSSYMTPFLNREESVRLGKELRFLNRMNPLLLVKDFSSYGELKQDNRFMSNGDVNAIAFDKDSPLKEVSREERILRTAYTLGWQTRFLENRDKHTYDGFYRVRNNLFDLKNWEEIRTEND